MPSGYAVKPKMDSQPIDTVAVWWASWPGFFKVDSSNNEVLPTTFVSR